MVAAASVPGLLLVCTHTVESPRTHTRSCVQLLLADSYKYQDCLCSPAGCSVCVSGLAGLLFHCYGAPLRRGVTFGNNAGTHLNAPSVSRQNLVDGLIMLGEFCTVIRFFLLE